MKIAIMGAGGVGGYFGGLLAKGDHDVHFLARGAHLKAIKKDGLTIEGVEEEGFTLPVSATENPEDIGPVDLVLFCVKSYDTDSSASMLSPLLGPETVVLTLQNGVDNEEKIQKIIGKEKVMGGVAYMSSQVIQPGIIRKAGGPRKIVFGEMDGSMTERAKEIRKVFESGGIDCEISEQIQKVLWEKFLFICAMGGMTAVTRKPIGPIRKFPQAWEMCIAVMREVGEVAKALSIPLDGEIVEKSTSLIQGFPENTRASLLADLEMGKRLEIDALNGTVVRLGEEHGVSTPTNRFIYQCLKLHDLEAEKGVLFCSECNTSCLPETNYCPMCGEPLEEEIEEELLGERIPCADDSCIGIIGTDGRCGTCGKKPQEVSPEEIGE
jgi:2-dehydropantoate 2-reductase